MDEETVKLKMAQKHSKADQKVPDEIFHIPATIDGCLFDGMQLSKEKENYDFFSEQVNSLVENTAHTKPIDDESSSDSDSDSNSSDSSTSSSSSDSSVGSNKSVRHDDSDIDEEVKSVVQTQNRTQRSCHLNDKSEDDEGNVKQTGDGSGQTKIDKSDVSEQSSDSNEENSNTKVSPFQRHQTVESLVIEHSKSRKVKKSKKKADRHFERDYQDNVDDVKESRREHIRDVSHSNIGRSHSGAKGELVNTNPTDSHEIYLKKGKRRKLLQDLSGGDTTDKSVLTPSGVSTEPTEADLKKKRSKRTQANNTVSVAVAKDVKNSQEKSEHDDKKKKCDKKRKNLDQGLNGGDTTDKGVLNPSDVSNEPIEADLKEKRAKRMRSNNTVPVAVVKVVKNKLNKSECAQRPGKTVEEVLSQRLGKKNAIEFLIKWEGYDHSFNSWEPAENLNCKTKLQTFLEKCAQSSTEIPKQKISEFKTAQEIPITKKKRINEGQVRRGRSNQTETLETVSLSEITHFSYVQVKKGVENGTIVELMDDPTDTIQTLCMADTKQVIAHHFICTKCKAILQVEKKTHSNVLKRHRMGCNAPREAKISISPANFRSLLMDVMSLVNEYGPVEMSGILIPKTMNEVNCNQFMADLESKVKPKKVSSRKS